MKRYCNLFLIVLGAFTAIFAIYLIYACCTLQQSQKEIKNSYAQHIVKADSMYLLLLNYNKDMAIYKQKVNDAILADSLINNVLKNTEHLTKAQSRKLQFIIENHFNQIDQLHNKYEEKLLKDSLRLCTERELLDGQTKTMIDLHLNKVEHEYSNITIWAAALTILFLVFSFYSIYKMDELIKQGNDGLKEIKRTRRESEQTKNQVEKECRKLLEEARRKTNEIASKYIRKLITLYNETKTEKEKVYNSKEQDFDTLVAKANLLIAQLNAYKDSIENSKQESNEEEEIKK